MIDILENVINRYKDKFLLLICGSVGSGKTTISLLSGLFFSLKGYDIVFVSDNIQQIPSFFKNFFKAYKLTNKKIKFIKYDKNFKENIKGYNKDKTVFIIDSMFEYYTDFRKKIFTLKLKNVVQIIQTRKNGALTIGTKNNLFYKCDLALKIDNYGFNSKDFEISCLKSRFLDKNSIKEKLNVDDFIRKIKSHFRKEKIDNILKNV